MLADQTPTPTRLIRNCDEVGLFDDLRHVNPFDETFRRAVESDCGDQSESYDSSKCSKPKLTTQTTLEALTLHNEETLHTPNVMPYVEAVSASKMKLKSAISLDEELLQPVGNTALKQETEEVGVSTNKDVQMSTESSSSTNSTHLVAPNGVEAKSILLISTVATPYLISTQPTPDPSTIGRPLKKLCPKKAPVVEHPIKEKLKQLILRAKVTTTTMAPVPKEAVVVQKSNPVNREKPKPSKRSITEKSSANSDIERNRLAAQRYRVKVKKNQNLLRQRNTELEAENERLRAELKTIKAILLSHQDCSVTRALNQRMITLQTQCTIGGDGESKPSIYYLVGGTKSNNGNPGKS